MSPILPFRPLPQRHENAMGYVIRLANANHFRNLTEFLKAYSVGKLSFQYNELSIAAYITLAVRLTGHKLETSNFPIAGEWSEDPEFENSKRLTFSRKPCICPECIRENGYIKSAWQYTVASFCTVHKCSIINVCPSCRRELVWNTHLLNLKCQRCNRTLTSETIIEPPHISEMRAMTDEQKWRYAAKLRELAPTYMRPFDLMVKSIGKAPIMIDNWNALYTLIANHLQKKIEKPSAYLLRTTANAEYKDYIQSPLMRGMMGVSKRKPTNEECRNFMDGRALKHWFGLEPYHLQTCLDMKYAKVVFKTPYSNTLIYDFTDWQIMFRKFRVLQGEGTDITQVASEAPVFWCHEEEVVVGVLRGKIPVRFKNSEAPDFREAWVDRAAAHYYLRKQKTLRRGSVMTISQVCYALGVKGKEIRKLIKNGILKEYQTTSHIELVSIDSVDNIIETVDFPHRRAILNDFSSINFER